MSKTKKTNKIQLEPVPEVGKEYHFWDDGKGSASRHYICRCERVLPYKEAKNIKFTLKEYLPPYTKDSEYKEYDTNLAKIWKDAVKHYHWLYAEDTDYFVEVSCPTYDENTLWAARTKWGGWFTMDIQTSWQGGDIDVTGEKFNKIIEELEDEGNYDYIEGYKEATYDK